MADDTQDLLRLADEVEKATGPDRRLDGRIWWHLQDKERLWRMSGMNAQRAAWTESDLRKVVERDPDEYGPVPRYTALLDAAMTLVPRDAVWSVNSDGESATGSVYRRRSDGSFIAHAGAVVEAATPAVALVACALRARAHSTKDTSNVG